MRLALTSSIAACALAFATSAAAAPAPGDVDLSFGNRGYVGGDVYPSLGATAMAVGPQGETFVLEPRVDPGCTSGGFCRIELTVAKFSRDGVRDTTFATDPGLVIYGSPYLRGEIAVGADGRPVIAAVEQSVLFEVGPGGTQVKPGTSRSVLVARLDAGGDLDASFGLGGRVVDRIESPSGTPPALAVLPDGRIVVAAEASSGGAPGALVLARYLYSGSLDPSFGDKGKLTTRLGTQSRPAGIAVRESAAAGSFEIGLSECCKGEGGTANALTFGRFLPDGGFDGSLAGDGSSVLARGQPSLLRSLAPAGGGKLYAAVEEESRGSVIVRLTPGGFPDPSFGKGGEVALGPELGVTGIVQVAPDSRGGVVGVAGQGSGVEVLRLRANGTPDRTFAAGKPVSIYVDGVNARSTGFGFQPDGRIVVLGEWGAGTKAFLLARLAGGTSKARCLGKKATVVGTRGKDNIRGTGGRDVIAALGGADKVRGVGGEDLICGGAGRDKLFGGAGVDKVRQ